MKNWMSNTPCFEKSCFGMWGYVEGGINRGCDKCECLWHCREKFFSRSTGQGYIKL